MNCESGLSVDWEKWFQRWEQYMNAVVPYREERFKAMLDVLEALMPTDFSTLDIGCGPGSFSKRLLERFSRTKCIAVDFDPVFLKIGQSALGSMDGRLEWIDMNILEPKWLTRVGLGQVNAVVSTSAFHNLTTGQIIDTYRGIALLLRPGDVFLNADLLPFSHTLPTFNLLTEKAYSRDQNGRFDQLDMDVSEGWMSAFERMEPDLLPLVREREHRRNEWGTPGRIRTTIDMHEATLQEAGFREVGVVWQRLDHRVVMAVR